MKLSEELEQLLKNLHLKRILELYDEQLSAAEKEDVSYSEFLTRLLRAQWHNRQETALAWRIKQAKLPEQLVAGQLPLRPPTRGQPQTDPRLRRTGVRRQGRKYRVDRKHWRRQDGTGLGPAAQSLGEWLSLSVHPRPGSVRRNVCLAGRPFLAPTAEPSGSSGRLAIDELRYLNLKPEQSNIFFKLMEERYHRHSTIITSNFVYDEWRNFLGNQAMVDALLSRAPPLLPHRSHQRPVAARSARLKGKSWRNRPAAKSMCARFSTPIAKRRGPRRVRRPIAGWPPNSTNAACP